MTAVKPASPDHGAPAAPEPWAWPPATPTPSAFSRRPWIAPIAVGLLGIAATTYTGVNDPNTSHAFPLCPLKAVTGIDCPMCGGLRAVHSLTHFDLIGAADHNIAVVLLLPFAAYWYLSWLGRSLGRPLPELRVSRQVWSVLMVGLMVFGVVRNLPVPGHDFLNSTALLAGRSA